jgi:hypothetical protein
MHKRYLLYKTSILVFIHYYKIVILYFYCDTFNIALGGILYQKLPKKL